MNHHSQAAAELESDVWRPHVTVATVVPRDDGRFLVVEEDVRGAIVLNQPAGHLDPDESLVAAAVRETFEETGWHVELDCLLGVQQWRAPGGSDFVRFNFAARALRHDPAHPLDMGLLLSICLKF
jgi:8-oxo-dGTP pyrophosphatase MutT (NUDIX family)